MGEGEENILGWGNHIQEALEVGKREEPNVFWGWRAADGDGVGWVELDGVGEVRRDKGLT